MTGLKHGAFNTKQGEFVGSIEVGDVFEKNSNGYASFG